MVLWIHRELRCPEGIDALRAFRRLLDNHCDCSDFLCCDHDQFVISVENFDLKMLPVFLRSGLKRCTTVKHIDLPERCTSW